ncbi:hypothetical protein MRS44_018424 [Fusarium solani]|uniref:uncharacterized protein n=1 Tax=Fusarium solani TaxID=169388 RepID=UPI0032C3E6BF|nr:hypothetical protein MRS44_018424 [Fusarium solani]
MAQTGPPQQQLLQYHYQPQQLQQNSPQSLTETLYDGSRTGLWKTKLSLRISSFLACTVNIGLCIQIAISWSMLPICLFAPPAGIAACWNFIESISLCSHRDHRGFHPVICIVVDLLLWFGFTTSSVLMGVLGIEEDADYSGWYLNPEEADDFYYAALGMGILEILFHITLFVMTCYETHQQSIQPRIIYVQSGPNGAILISPLGYPITGQPQEGGLPQRNTENDRKNVPHKYPMISFPSSTSNTYEFADIDPSKSAEPLVEKNKRLLRLYGNSTNQRQPSPSPVRGMDMLYNAASQQLAADFPGPEHFRIGINLAWGKLDEYYQRLDETPIYYSAMALHPAYRWDWFDETWAHKPSWVEKAKEMVAVVWLSDYAHLEVRTSSRRGDNEPPAKRPRVFNPFEKNSPLPRSIPAYAAAIVGDEYQAWQTDREASDVNPMSAEGERLFSAAGKMVSGLRTGLDAEIIAIYQVLRSWYRAGLIKDLDPLFNSHLESKLDAGCGTLSDDELALAESKWLLEGEDSASEVDDSSQQQQAEELVSTSENEAG